MAEDKKAEKDAKKPAKADKSDKKPGKSKKSKKNPLKSIATFFKGVNAERKKVVWPTAKETIKNTGIVLLVSIVVGVAIYGVDTALSLSLKGVKSLKENTTVSDTADETSESDIDVELGSDDDTDADADADTDSDDTAEDTAE